MSFLKKPLKRLTGNFKSDNPKDLQNKEEGFSTIKRDGSTPTSSLEAGYASPNGTPRQSREILRKEKVRDLDRKKAEARKKQSMRRKESEAYMRDAPPELTRLYKPYSMNMSKRWNHENRIRFKDLDFESMSCPARYLALRSCLRIAY
jgi:hypothetical protein